MAFVAVGLIALAVLTALAWGLGRGSARQQASMRAEAEDLRSADDGGDSAFSDYGSPMG